MSESTPIPAGILLVDHSIVIGTTATQVFAPGQLTQGMRFMRLVNYATNNGTIWISRSGTAAIGAAGSYPLPPGVEERWDGNFIPVNALSAVASLPNTLLTIEMG